jgi:hypothetical protein
MTNCDLCKLLNPLILLFIGPWFSYNKSVFFQITCITNPRVRLYTRIYCLFSDTVCSSEYCVERKDDQWMMIWILCWRKWLYTISRWYPRIFMIKWSKLKTQYVRCSSQNSKHAPHKYSRSWNISKPRTEWIRKYTKTCLKRNLKGPVYFSAEARFPFNQDILTKKKN